MTDLEINKALTLAIGYRPEHILTSRGSSGVMVFRPLTEVVLSAPKAYEFMWYPFDYRDWNVIGPIAERYDCFPIKATDPEQGEWLTAIGYVIYTDTPQKAIAMAVIGANK